MEIKSKRAAGASPHEESALWRRWWQQRDALAREQLVAIHFEFARMLAAVVFRGRYNECIEFDDYLQLATVGLLEAIDRYDDTRGA
ncbi:MAG TPA: hypothetical protein VIT92_10475, partial [Burkholderiaceae bacterium]